MASWWGRESHKGTPVVVKMENPNWSIVEVESPSDEDFIIGAESPPGRARDKGRGKNAKQLTWVLLLKAHKAAGCLTSIGSALVNIVTVVKRRLASGRTDADTDADNDNADGGVRENPIVKTRFYLFIKVFLWLSVLLLGFELAAYYKGWHFEAPHLQLDYLWTTPFGVKDAFDWLYSKWVVIRVAYFAPPLQFLANVCIVLFLIQTLDRLILCLGCFWIRFKKIKPVPKDAAMDLESGETGYFPMVLVQIPMCNEKEVNLEF